MIVYLVCLHNISQKPPQKVAFLPKYRLGQRPLSTPPYRRYEKLPARNKVVRLFHHGAASLYDTSGWLGGEHTRKGNSESSKEYPTIWFQVITWWSTYFKPRDMGWSATPPSNKNLSVDVQMIYLFRISLCGQWSTRIIFSYSAAFYPQTMGGLW